jgi:Methyltransferase domain
MPANPNPNSVSDLESQAVSDAAAGEGADWVAMRQAVLAQFGPWTNHNLRLPDGSYTVAVQATPCEPKLRRMTQIVLDWLRRDRLDGIRVLDLACLEGLYGLELALHGAEAVGIEGREMNRAKAEVARQALGVENIRFVLDDVRNLSPQTYGTFDVVLCLGILYHLDAPEVFRLVEQVAEVCTGLAIIDTHVSQTAEQCHPYRTAAGAELSLWGRSYREHDPDSPRAARLQVPESSLDNPESFWLTRASLLNLMAAAGFTSVYECHQPLVQKYEDLRAAGLRDRATFVAIKGQPVTLRASDLSNGQPPLQWPERPVSG